MLNQQRLVRIKLLSPSIADAPAVAADRSAVVVVAVAILLLLLLMLLILNYDKLINDEFFAPAIDQR